MTDFFLKVWAKNVGAHYTQEHIIHSKIQQLCLLRLFEDTEHTEAPLTSDTAPFPERVSVDDARGKGNGEAYTGS